jgi:hypothetical protein
MALRKWQDKTPAMAAIKGLAKPKAPKGAQEGRTKGKPKK